MNLASLLENNANKYPNKSAIKYLREEYSYHELDRMASAIAQGLKYFGVEKGDRVGLLLPNSPEFVFLLFGIWKTGAIGVNLNIMFKEEEIRQVLSDSQAKILFTTGEFLPLIDQVKKKIKTLKTLVVKEANPRVDLIPLKKFTSDYPGEYRAIPIDKKDLAIISYTSGTTGVAKGVAHTHHNLYSHLENYSHIMGFSGDDRILCVLPLFQLVAMMIHLGIAIYNCSSLYIQGKFSAPEFLECIKKERITFFATVPTVFYMLNANPKTSASSFSSVRFAICAGSPLPLSLREAVQNKFFLRIIHAYGMTEISLIAACDRLDEPSRSISVGRFLPYMKYKIIGEKGNQVPSGEVGEICLGAEMAMVGYWNQPEETSLTLKDGWFKTGDLGRLDKDGHLYIVDRKKDMIIRGGFNIFPAEIEKVLLSDERVSECAVIGVPNDRLGEVPKAYISLKEETRATEKEFIDLVRNKLSHYKALEYVGFVTADFFPRNQLGKIVKKGLKEKVLAKNHVNPVHPVKKT